MSKIVRNIKETKEDFFKLVNKKAFIKIIDYTPKSAEIEE